TEVYPVALHDALPISKCGVRRLIVTGSSAESSGDAAKLAATRPGLLYATAGVHPHHASEYTAEVNDRLLALLNSDNVVAVGECGDRKSTRLNSSHVKN